MRRGESNGLKSCSLDQASVILPSCTKLYLSWPHAIKYQFSPMHSMPIQCTPCYLESSCTSMGLKTRISHLCRKDPKKKNQSSVDNHYDLP